MNKIEVGKSYTANFEKKGNSEKGPWQMIVTNSEDKQTTNMTIWNNNPIEDLHKGDTFTIKKIESVSFRWEKKDVNNHGKNEVRWNPNISMNATVEKIKSDLLNVGADASLDDLSLPTEWLENEGDLPY